MSPGRRIMERRWRRSQRGLTRRVCLLAASVVLLPITAHSAWSQETSAPRVLILHSYSEESSWTRSQNRALHQELARRVPAALLFVEHLDSKRYAFERIAGPFRALLAAKYDLSEEETAFDVLVTTDDNAAAFVARRRESLFGGIPVVFTGANRYDEEFRRKLAPATGVAEEPDIAGTIDLARRLHPDARTLVSVSDVTTTGKLNQERFDRAVAPLAEEYRIVRLAGLPLPELEERLSSLPDESIVFNLSLFRSADERRFTTESGTAFLTANTDAPIYTCWDFGVRNGVIGGLTVSGAAQGTRAAEMVASILSGTPAAEIPVATTSPNRYVFDYAALQEHGIQVSRLPAPRTLLNEPESIWYRYSRVLTAALAVFTGLVLGALLLLINLLQRRRIQKQLERSEARYRRVFHNLQDVYMEIDRRSGRLVEISPSVRQFGYDRGALLGTPAAALFTDPEAWRDICRAAAGSVLDHETYLVPGSRWSADSSAESFGDGVEGIPVAVTAGIPDGESDPFVVATLRDISQRRKKDDELRRLYHAVEEAGHAIYITDIAGTIEYVNSAFEKITGYRRAEAIGGTPRLFKSGKMSSSYYASLWNTISHGRIWAEEITNARKDGTEYVAQQTISPVCDRHGEPQWYVAVQMDKTEQKRTEQALAESERHYRLLAENATDMISRHDESGTYRYVSPACRTLMGYEPEDLVGANPYDLFHPDDRPSIARSHEEIERGHEVAFVTYRIRRADGGYVWVETTSKTLRDPDTGEIREIVAITRDASRRIAMEERLRGAKQTAEEASRAKSSFLANMSHEFRTPLNAIMGLGELLERRADDPSSRRHLQTIRTSARTLLQLINDILDLSKVEAGRLDINPDYVTIANLLGDVARIFEAQLSSSPVALAVDDAAVRGYEVRTDPQRLRQVLINLVGNAVKFTRWGSIRISGDFTPGEDNTGTLRLSVADTGIGITEEKRERIFDAFVQGDGSSTREFGGTGLGLSISKHIVELLGGEITVSSTPEIGSTFTIHLTGLWYYYRSDQTAGSAPEDHTYATGTAQAPTAAEQPSFTELTPALRHELRRSLGPRWRQVQRVKRFDELAGFARELNTLATLHGAEALLELGRQLQEVAADFDVAGLDKVMSRIAVLMDDEGEDPDGTAPDSYR